MNVELVAQMFKNYQSNVLFHLEGVSPSLSFQCVYFENEADCSSHGESEGAVMKIYIDAGKTYVDSRH